jgi:hypothetical protein
MGGTDSELCTSGSFDVNGVKPFGSTVGILFGRRYCVSNKTGRFNFLTFTTLCTKSSVFWDITPCNPFESQMMLRSNISPPSSGRRINQAKNRHESDWFLALFIFWPCRWRRHILPKRRLTFNGLHGVISQKVGRIFHNLCCENVKSYIL